MMMSLYYVRILLFVVSDQKIIVCFVSLCCKFTILVTLVIIMDEDIGWVEIRTYHWKNVSVAIGIKKEYVV